MWASGSTLLQSSLYNKLNFAFTAKMYSNKKYFRSSRIVLSHITIEFVQTRNSAIRSTVPENPTVEPNMKWIG